MKRLIFGFLLFDLGLSTVLGGCGDGSGGGGEGGGGPSRHILFEDHFEYTVASPWTPENGWSSTGTWNIVTGGVTGNALEFPPGNSVSFVINDFSGSNYEVAVRFKAVSTITGGWPIYLLARAQDSDNWYAAGIYEDTEKNVYLITSENVAGSASLLNTSKFKDGLLDNGTYYTLRIKVDGNNITATCSGGGFSTTTTATATDFTDGKVGIGVWTNPGPYNVLFDDFTVSSV